MSILEEHLFHYRWFQPDIDQKRVEDDCKNASVGNFIVYYSADLGSLVVSWKIDSDTNNISHVQVRKEDSGWRLENLENKNLYSTLVALLESLSLANVDDKITSVSVNDVESPSLAAYEPSFVESCEDSDHVVSILEEPMSFFVHPGQKHHDFELVRRSPDGDNVITEIIHYDGKVWWIESGEPGVSELRFKSLNALLQAMPVSFCNPRFAVEKEADWWYFDDKFLSCKEWDEVQLNNALPSFSRLCVYNEGKSLHDNCWKQLQRTLNYLDLENVGFTSCVTSAYAIDNPYLRAGFYAYHEEFASDQVATGKLFEQSLCSNNVSPEIQWRKEIHDELHRRQGEFRATHKVKRGDYIGVGKTVSLHGTSPTVAQHIACGGLKKMYRPKEKKDWYGTGSYTTDSLLYALLFSYLGLKHEFEKKGLDPSDARQQALNSDSYAVVVCFIQWRQAYPCTENPLENDSLVQKSLKPGFDMHHTVVSPSDRGRTVWVPQQVVAKGTPKAAEYCIDRVPGMDVEQILPMYIVHFQLTGPVVDKMESLISTKKSASAKTLTTTTPLLEKNMDTEDGGKELCLGFVSSDPGPRKAPSESIFRGIKMSKSELGKGRMNQIKELQEENQRLRAELELQRKLIDQKWKQKIDDQVKKKLAQRLKQLGLEKE